MKKPLRRQNFGKARHIETTKIPKLNGEQRPVGFKPRQFGKSEWWEMVESFAETIALDVSMDNWKKLKDSVGKMRTLPEGNFGRIFFFGKAANIEATISPKLNGEQRPVASGQRQFQYQGMNFGKRWTFAFLWRKIWENYGHWGTALLK